MTAQELAKMWGQEMVLALVLASLAWARVSECALALGSDIA